MKVYRTGEPDGGPYASVVFNFNRRDFGLGAIPTVGWNGDMLAFDCWIRVGPVEILTCIAWVWKETPRVP